MENRQMRKERQCPFIYFLVFLCVNAQWVTLPRWHLRGKVLVQHWGVVIHIIAYSGTYCWAGQTDTNKLDLKKQTPLLFCICMCPALWFVWGCIYLLLVLPLQVQSGLDVSSRLLEGLPLRDFGGVMGADPDHISAQEDQHVGTDLKKIEVTQTKREYYMWIPPSMCMSNRKAQWTLSDLGEDNKTKLITLCVRGFTARRNIPQTSEEPLDAMWLETMSEASWSLWKGTVSLRWIRVW